MNLCYQTIVYENSKRWTKYTASTTTCQLLKLRYSQDASLSTHNETFITIRCESDDALLILDQPNRQMSNMEKWEFVSDQEVRCYQTPGREFSYVSFACAWQNADAVPVIGSVAIDEVQADCRANPHEDTPVLTGMSLGRLCPGPFGNVLYDSTETTCPATSFRDGCVEHGPCRDCVRPGWKVTNELQPTDACRADSLNTTVLGEAFANPHVLDNFESIVDDNRRFYDVTDEEG